jgi:hypothetical protein
LRSEGQARLAHTTLAGQGQHADVRLTHESLKRRDLPLAANEASQGRRQMALKPFRSGTRTAGIDEVRRVLANLESAMVSPAEESCRAVHHAHLGLLGQ